MATIYLDKFLTYKGTPGPNVLKTLPLILPPPMYFNSLKPASVFGGVGKSNLLGKCFSSELRIRLRTSHYVLVSLDSPSSMKLEFTLQSSLYAF